MMGQMAGSPIFMPANPMMSTPAQYPPDWKCLSCANINFAKRTECKMCSAPRTAESPATHISSKYQPDWKCTSCGNVNFAKRQECKQCAAPRTEDAEAAYAPTHAIHKMNRPMGGMGMMGMMGMGMGMGMGGGGGGGGMQSAKPGDWNCAGCGYLNFARRSECGKCNAAKPPGSEVSASGGGLSSYRHTPY